MTVWTVTKASAPIVQAPDTELMHVLRRGCASRFYGFGIQCYGALLPPTGMELGPRIAHGRNARRTSLPYFTYLPGVRHLTQKLQLWSCLHRASNRQWTAVSLSVHTWQ